MNRSLQEISDRLEISMLDGKTQFFMCGPWYVDEYRRTDSGWRISKRVEEKSYVLNML